MSQKPNSLFAYYSGSHLCDEERTEGRWFNGVFIDGNYNLWEHVSTGIDLDGTDPVSGEPHDDTGVWYLAPSTRVLAPVDTFHLVSDFDEEDSHGGFNTLEVVYEGLTITQANNCDHESSDGYAVVDNLVALARRGKIKLTANDAALKCYSNLCQFLES